METSYLSAQAFSGADLLHGPLAMIDPQVPVLTVVADGVGGRAMQQVLPRLAEQGADVFCVGTPEAVGRPHGRRAARRGAGGAVPDPGDPAVPAAGAAPGGRPRRRPGRPARPAQGHRDTVIGTVLTAAAVVVTAQSIAPGWLEIAGDRIAAVGAGQPPRRPMSIWATRRWSRASSTSTARRRWRRLHRGSEDAALRAARFHRARGTTTMLASLVTARPEELRTGVTVLAGLAAEGEIAGIHLEGPVALRAPLRLRTPRRCCATPTRPSSTTSSRPARAVRMVTLAPERAGALDAIRQVVDTGRLPPSVTPTRPSHHRAALAAGASVATHLFNAMRPPHHREPGPVVALVEDPTRFWSWYWTTSTCIPRCSGRCWPPRAAIGSLWSPTPWRRPG